MSEILNNLSTVQLILIGGAIFLLIIIVFILFELTRRNKKSKAYVQMFEEFYKNDSVCDSLIKIKDTFNKNCIEKVALEKSINYLQNSCLKDYQTAFAIIEDVYGGKKVENFHDVVLEKERQKVMLLLDKKEG